MSDLIRSGEGQIGADSAVQHEQSPAMPLDTINLGLAQALLDIAGVISHQEHIDPRSLVSSEARLLYGRVYAELQTYQSRFYRH